MAKKKITNRTDAEKKAILLKHYDMSEIEEIMGFHDGSNEDVCTPEFEEAYKHDYERFKELMLAEAINNGNFEEVIWYDARLAL